MRHIEVSWSRAEHRYLVEFCQLKNPQAAAPIRWELVKQIVKKKVFVESAPIGSSCELCPTGDLAGSSRHLQRTSTAMNHVMHAACMPKNVRARGVRTRAVLCPAACFSEVSEQFFTSYACCMLGKNFLSIEYKPTSEECLFGLVAWLIAFQIKTFVVSSGILP